MIPVFIKEQKRYSQSDLQNLFNNCSEEKIIYCIRILKEYDILYSVKKR